MVKSSSAPFSTWPFLAAALALAAGCAKQEASPVKPPDKPEKSEPGLPPRPAATLGRVDLTKPVRLVGTEPFWGADITPAAVRLEGLDRPVQAGANPGPNLGPDSAEWMTTADDGARLHVVVRLKACSDGMSERAYPLEAEVSVDRPEPVTLKGCADQADALKSPAEGG